MKPKIPITIAYGDGIGPEIMEAVLRILKNAEAPLSYETIEIGEHVYKRGIASGIEHEAWESLQRTKVFLKAPITTPQGGGVKSLNVTVRKTLGLYANVRPCISYNPYIQAKHPDMDVVIIRENEEDLYGGIEHQQTPEVVQCLKLISVPGCERIVRFAFEYAKHYAREKITCMTKDNIMKLSDGLFHQTFKRIALEYPDIKTEHMIIDIGAARLADTPERFDVVVVPNLYGDILSDIAAQIAGSVGLVGSANIGEQCAMFEAIHGSAPDIAGKNIANPSGLLMAAVMMLVHLGEVKIASSVENAWLKTIEEGILTTDVFNATMVKKEVSTKEFATAVIENLGQKPTRLTPADYPSLEKSITSFRYKRSEQLVSRKLVGVDVFVCQAPGHIDRLIDQLKSAENSLFKLSLITNRGTKIWPEGFPETFCTDHWRCRYSSENANLAFADLIRLYQQLGEKGIDVIKTEHLYEIDGKPAYSKGQGE